MKTSEFSELAKTERMVLETIKSRNIRYFGHELLRLIIQGKIEGRREAGRRKTSWIKNIREWADIATVGELILFAENRNDDDDDDY